MSDRRDVVHQDIGTDGLEVEEYSIHEEEEHHGEVEGVVHLVQLHHQEAGRDLHPYWRYTGVEL